MLKKEFTSAVTIMPPIRHDNQPFRHFVKPKGTPLCPDGCLEMASIFFFMLQDVLLIFVKLVRCESSHV